MWWISFLLCYNFAKANFAKTYGDTGDEYAECIYQTQDGGFIVAGYTDSYGAGGLDFLVFKLTSTGDVSWAKTYGHAGDDKAYHIEQTQDGGFIMAGCASTGGTNREMIVLKLTSNGDISWAKAFNTGQESYATCVRQTQDNGFIIAGETGNWPSYTFWIIKLTFAGDIEWAKTYGISGKNRFIEQTQDEGFIVVGGTDSHGAGSYDFAVFKLTSTGDVSWAKTYGELLSDQPWHGHQTQDNGFVVVGWTRLGAGEYDCLVLKLTSTGDVSWAKTYGELWSDNLGCVQETKDGGFIVAGETFNFSTAQNACLIIKLTSTGDVSWARVFDGTDFDLAYTVQQTQDSGFVITGATDSYGAGGVDCLIFKITKDGSYPDDCDPFKSCTPIVYSPDISGVPQTISSSSLTAIRDVTPETSSVLLKVYDICSTATAIEEIRRQDIEPLLNVTPTFSIDGRFTIEYTVREPTSLIVPVSLKIYDMCGKLVKILIEEKKYRGKYKTIWNGRDSMNKRVASGIYFVQIIIKGLRQTRKMCVLP